MTRHKWADLIIEWAEGAEIQFSSVRNTDDSGWKDCEGITFSWDCEMFKFRRKPKEPEWWENIPEHGVLCWVSDKDANTRSTIVRITVKNNDIWGYITPLTNEEIERFKR